MMEILKEFCADKYEKRKYLQSPFSWGEYSYATDGHTLVRVKRLDSVPEVSGAPKCDSLFKDTYSGFIEIPIVDEPEPRQLCDECSGNKIVNCHCCGQESECEFCYDGYVNPLIKAVKIGEESFDKKLIWKIKKLPNCKISAPHTFPTAAYFIFDGGDGLVMPIRDR